MMRWIRVAAGTACLACLTVSSSAVAAGPGCAPTREVGIVPVVTVVPEVPNPQYRYDVGREQLTQMMNTKGSNGGHHSMTLGLTVGTFQTYWQIAARTIQKGNLYCHYLVSATVRLQVPSLTVYVAKEYRSGSCQYLAITAHENQHVQVNQSVVRKYAPMLREVLLSAVYRASPVPGHSPQGGPQALEEALRGTITKVVEDMYRERDRDNGAIDTDDAYRRAAKRCNGW
jgi:hypothetical protein